METHGAEQKAMDIHWETIEIHGVNSKAMNFHGNTMKAHGALQQSHGYSLGDHEILWC